jgi:hypothetical protein
VSWGSTPSLPTDPAGGGLDADGYPGGVTTPMSEWVAPGCVFSCGATRTEVHVGP